MLCCVGGVTTDSSDNDTWMYCNSGIILFDKTIGSSEWKSMGLYGTVQYVALCSPSIHGAGHLPWDLYPTVKVAVPSNLPLRLSFNPGEKAVLTNDVHSGPLVQEEIWMLKFFSSFFMIEIACVKRLNLSLWDWLLPFFKHIPVISNSLLGNYAYKFCIIFFSPFSSLNRRTRDLLVKWTISSMKSGTIFCYLTDGGSCWFHASVCRALAAGHLPAPALPAPALVLWEELGQNTSAQERNRVLSHTVKNASTGYMWKVYIVPYLTKF